VKPIRIDLTEDDLYYSLKLGKFRYGPFKSAKKDGIQGNTKNSQNFYEDKAPWYRSFIGAIGEVAYSKWTGWPIVETTWNKGDSVEDGTDFPDGSNTKSSAEDYKPNLLIPVVHYKKWIPKSYVLAWVKLRRRECFLLGKISRIKADEVKYCVKKGDRKMKVNTYWIERQHLTIADLYPF